MSKAFLLAFSFYIIGQIHANVTPGPDLKHDVVCSLPFFSRVRAYLSYYTVMSSIDSKGDRDLVEGKDNLPGHYIQQQNGSDELEEGASRQVDWTESEEKRAKRK